MNKCCSVREKKIKKKMCCMMCMSEILSEILSIKCGHIYHKECIEKWKIYNDVSCPECFIWECS